MKTWLLLRTRTWTMLPNELVTCVELYDASKMTTAHTYGRGIPWPPTSKVILARARKREHPFVFWWFLEPCLNVCYITNISSLHILTGYISFTPSSYPNQLHSPLWLKTKPKKNNATTTDTDTQNTPHCTGTMHAMYNTKSLMTTRAWQRSCQWWNLSLEREVYTTPMLGWSWPLNAFPLSTRALPRMAPQSLKTMALHLLTERKGLSSQILE